jgi:hypothetical protein
MASMELRPIVQESLMTLAWGEDYAPGWFRIVADITCSRCGAYQAVDSDPVQDKEESVRLSLRLLNHVGWRVDDRDQVLCPDCAPGSPSNRHGEV